MSFLLCLDARSTIKKSKRLIREQNDLLCNNNLTNQKPRGGMDSSLDVDLYVLGSPT